MFPVAVVQRRPADVPGFVGLRADAASAPASGETVVVTGSLIARPDYNTATPTVSVTADTLKNSGQISLESGLKDLPQFSTSTGGAGSFIGGSGQVNVRAFVAWAPSATWCCWMAAVCCLPTRTARWI